MLILELLNLFWRGFNPVVEVRQRPGGFDEGFFGLAYRVIVRLNFLFSNLEIGLGLSSLCGLLGFPDQVSLFLGFFTGLSTFLFCVVERALFDR